MKTFKISLIFIFTIAFLLVPVVSQQSQNLLKAKVTRVVDGDTIDIRLSDGDRDTVRYIGIDTPETHGAVECFGKKASAYNKALVGSKTVWLELDVEERDKYGGF